MSLKNKKVLVVDDEPDLREILIDELTLAGAEVDAAKNGIEGYQKAHEKKFDIIISDIRMPGGDGASMAKKIRSESSHSTIIALVSGFSDLGFDEAYDLGADIYLAKPFSLSAVLSNLERQLKPLESRCQGIPPQSEVKIIQISASNFDEGIRTGQISIGRGGAYVRTDDHALKMGDAVKFIVGDFQGEGIIRWVRSDGQSNGVGIDFTWLGDNSLQYINQWLQKHPTIAYIPHK